MKSIFTCLLWLWLFVKSSLTYHCVRHIKCPFLVKSVVFELKCHWKLFPMVQSTLKQHRPWYWLIWTNGGLIYRRINVLLVELIELMHRCFWQHRFLLLYQFMENKDIYIYISWFRYFRASKWINPPFGWGLGCIHLSILSLLSHRSHHASVIHCLYYIGCCL